MKQNIDKIIILILLVTIINSIHVMQQLNSVSELYFQPLSLKDSCAHTITHNIWYTTKNKSFREENYINKIKIPKNRIKFLASLLTKQESLPKAFSAYHRPLLSHEHCVYLLHWLIKNPFSPINKSRESHRYSEKLLKRIDYSYPDDYILLDTLVNYYSDRIASFANSPKEIITKYMSFGTNPQTLLSACIEHSCNETYLFFLSKYRDWIINNTQIVHCIFEQSSSSKNHEYFLKELLKINPTLRVKKYILYFLCKYFPCNTNNYFKILLEYLPLSQQLFPLHKAIAYNPKLLKLLCESKKFDINAIHNNKTPIQLLLHDLEKVGYTSNDLTYQATAINPYYQYIIDLYHYGAILNKSDKDIIGKKIIPAVLASQFISDDFKIKLKNVFKDLFKIN